MAQRYKKKSTHCYVPPGQLEEKFPGGAIFSMIGAVIFFGYIAIAAIGILAKMFK
jgi:hypothetical protein